MRSHLPAAVRMVSPLTRHDHQRNPYSLIESGEAAGLAIQIRPLARLGQGQEILTHAGVAPGAAACSLKTTGVFPCFCLSSY